MARKRNSGTVTASFGSKTLLLKRRGERAGVEVSEGTVTVDASPHLAYDYVARVAILDEPIPRAEVVEVTIKARAGGPAVVARKVASELGRVRRGVVTTLSWRINEVGGQFRATLHPDPADVRSAMKVIGRGRPTVSPEELVETARLYLEAQAAGKPTTRAVELGLGVSRSTALKRVWQARKAGHLPPAESTRPRRPVLAK